jgi:hypothetical protein
MKNTANTFRGEFEVTYKGKTHKALFTMNAIRICLKGEGIVLENFDKWIQADPLTAVPSIAYYSILNHCIQNDKKFGAKKEQFIATLVDSEEFENVAEAITHAMSTGEEEGKK